jgi:sulfur carrier protein ThiS
MRNLLLFGLFMVFICICVGFLVTSVIFFTRLGRESISDTISRELDRIEQEKLPAPDNISIQFYDRAGVEIPLYVVSINYEFVDKSKAEETIKKIRERLR